jgi:DNA-binding MarR family transcriptional regulator
MENLKQKILAHLDAHGTASFAELAGATKLEHADLKVVIQQMRRDKLILVNNMITNEPVKITRNV